MFLAVEFLSVVNFCVLTAIDFRTSSAAERIENSIFSKIGLLETNQYSGSPAFVTVGAGKSKAARTHAFPTV